MNAVALHILIFVINISRKPLRLKKKKSKIPNTVQKSGIFAYLCKMYPMIYTHVCFYIHQEHLKLYLHIIIKWFL